MKKKTIKDSLAKLAKTENASRKLEKFLKTTSGQKFVNNIHKERIDVLCKRYHLDYIIYTNLTMAMNMVISAMKTTGVNPIGTVKKPIEWKQEHHPQPKRLVLHTRHNKYTSEIEEKSQCGEYCKKYDTLTSKLTRKELINGYKIHKLDKWILKNPEPVEQDSTGQLNMFYESSHEEWKKNIEGIKIKIEDQIIRKYNPNLTVIGRYSIGGDKYIQKPIGIIEDKENTARLINFLTEDKGIIKIAKDIMTKEKSKDDRLVCAYIRDHNNCTGRVILNSKIAA